MEQLFPFLPADTHVGAGPAVALSMLPLLQNASATRLESFFGVCAVCPEPCHQDNPVFLVFVARNSLKTILAPLKSHFRVFLTHLLPFIGVILCHTVPPSVLCLVATRFDVPRVSPVPVPPVGFVLTPHPPTGPNAVSVLFQVDTQRDGEEQASPPAVVLGEAEDAGAARA